MESLLYSITQQSVQDRTKDKGYLDQNKLVKNHKQKYFKKHFLKVTTSRMFRQILLRKRLAKIR